MGKMQRVLISKQVVHIETIVLFTINYYREQDQASEGATRTT
jgi:hypothetical protein